MEKTLTIHQYRLTRKHHEFSPSATFWTLSVYDRQTTDGNTTDGDKVSSNRTFKGPGELQLSHDNRVLAFTGSQKVTNMRALIDGLHPMRRFIKSPVTGNPIDTIVTGGCMGVDALVGRYLATHCPSLRHIVAMPANMTKVEQWWWAFSFVDVIVMAPGTSYMDRNDEMIRLATELMAFPNRPRQVRSGTWATVRRAETKGIPLKVVMQ